MQPYLYKLRPLKLPHNKPITVKKEKKNLFDLQKYGSGYCCPLIAFQYWIGITANTSTSSPYVMQVKCQA